MFNETILAQILDPLFLTKIGFIVFIGFYAIFTFVVFNQVKTMNKIVNEDKSSNFIFILSLLNMLLAVSLFIASLVIL